MYMYKSLTRFENFDDACTYKYIINIIKCVPVSSFQLYANGVQ